MKLITTILMTGLFSLSAEAGQISCISKYFNNGEMPVRLVANAVSETGLQNLTLQIDNQLVAKAKSVRGAEYDGRIYKNMMAFTLTPKGDWEFTSMKLLLPVGFSSLTDDTRFEGIITEAASDGGSYNRIFCKVVGTN